MGWLDCYREIKKLVESEKFKEMNRKSNPNDPESALAIALKQLYNEKNPWGENI